MMKRITIPGLFLIFLFGLSNAALAERPWSIAGHVSEVDLGTTSSETVDAFLGDVDDSRSGFGLSLSYRFLDNLGVRLMYERSTGFDMTNLCPPGATCPQVLITDEADLDAWTLAATPRLPLTDHFSMYGIAGATHWDISTTGTLPGDSGTDLTVGAGASWQPGEHFEVSLEYQYADFDYDAWRASLGFRF